MAKLKKEDWIVLYEEMSYYEKILRKTGYPLIAGMDEAGRGPLAGPVVAGVVILDPENPILGLRDSKKISQKKREELFDEICSKSLYHSIGMVDHQKIDQINVLNATRLAMKRAVENLPVQPDYLLIDSVVLEEVKIPQSSYDKGESLSVSIAAASILAKVTRDRLMEEYSRHYPGYHFEKHKGYGTSEHLKALSELGPSPIHRLSFKGVFCQDGEYELSDSFLEKRKEIDLCSSMDALISIGKELSITGKDFKERELKLLRKSYSIRKKILEH